MEDRGLLVKTGTIVDATIFAAPAARRTRAAGAIRRWAPRKKSGQWHFGLKAHIGADARSGLVHHVQTTPANVHDAKVLGDLVHGGEEVLVADNAYADITLKNQCRQAGLRYPIIDQGARYVKPAANNTEPTAGNPPSRRK